MNRHYTTEQYRKIVSDIRTVFDNPAITTDVMVGFAGETDEEFRESVKFVKSIGFAKVHVFPYSRRAGTAADKAPNHISSEIKKQRAYVMSQAAAEGAALFMESQIGRIEKVLVEAVNKDGKYEGYTMNYTPVHINADDSFIGKIVDVRLIRSHGDYCIGEIV